MDGNGLTHQECGSYDDGEHWQLCSTPIGITYLLGILLPEENKILLGILQ